MPKNVKAEFENTEKVFRWRLVAGSEKSEWSQYYVGILVHRFKDGEVYMLATQYWGGTLPYEVPVKLDVPNDFRAPNEYE